DQQAFRRKLIATDQPAAYDRTTIRRSACGEHHIARPSSHCSVHIDVAAVAARIERYAVAGYRTGNRQRTIRRLHIHNTGGLCRDTQIAHFAEKDTSAGTLRIERSDVRI